MTEEEHCSDDWVTPYKIESTDIGLRILTNCVCGGKIWEYYVKNEDNGNITKEKHVKKEDFIGSKTRAYPYALYVLDTPDIVTWIITDEEGEAEFNQYMWDEDPKPIVLSQYDADNIKAWLHGKNDSTTICDVWTKADIANSITGDPDSREITDDIIKRMTDWLRENYDPDVGINNEVLLRAYGEAIKK